MKKEYYRQCTFKADNQQTTAWIPEHGAKVGFSMTFPDTKDEVRWTVVSVSNERLLKEEIKNSDIFESIKK